MARLFIGSFLLLGALASSAVAGPRKRLETRRGPNMPVLKPAALSGHIIHLNRCTGGCQIAPGDDDGTATPITSGIANQQVTVAEATDLSAQEWEDTVRCVQEVYSP